MGEKAVKKQGLASKLIGDKKFYKMILLIAVPIMIQNGITNFVSLLDNIISLFLYTISASLEVYPEQVFLPPSILDKKTRRASEIPSAINYGWH